MTETNKVVWWCAGMMACVAGLLILGSRESADRTVHGRRNRRRGIQPPVEELASVLQEAWSGYHIR